MITLLDFKPNYCPSCGHPIGLEGSEEPKNADLNQQRYHECPNCGLKYHIGSLDDLLVTAAFISMKEKNDNVELIIGTKPTYTKNGNKERSLFVGDWPEVALIIEPDKSDEVMKKSVGELKTQAELFRKEVGTKPNKAFQIYCEYWKLFQSGWTYRQIAEQVNFDCLVCLFLLNDPGTSDELRQVSQTYFKLLLSFARFWPKRTNKIYDSALLSIQRGELPWIPETGPVDRFKVKDAFRGWVKEKKEKDINEPSGDINFLSKFWAITIVSPHWEKLEESIVSVNPESKIKEDLRYMYCFSEVRKWELKNSPLGNASD